MIEKIYKVKGMHCASCAGIIEKTFSKTEGVDKASANYGNESVKISFDSSKVSPEMLSKKIEPFGYSLAVEDAKSMNMTEDEHRMHTGVNQTKNEKLTEISEMRKKIFSIIPLAIISLFMMVYEILASYKIVPEFGPILENIFFYLMPIFATYSLFVVGKPYLLGVKRFLCYGKANMDTLIGIGTSVAYIYSLAITFFGNTLIKYFPNTNTYFDVTIIVIAFITLGKYLETKSKLKTGDAIEKLLNLQARTALVIRDGKEIEVSINDVVHGDIIVIKPGSKIPVDGIVTEGSSYIDESMISGEPMPVHKIVGDTVAAGTINTSGTFNFKATKVGGETLLAQIIKMVEDAQGSKAPIQALADKISSIFVPIVLVIAFLTFILWVVFGGDSGISYGLMSFVGVLVIACPCALGLATPTAIIVGVGKGAKEGILIKDAATLQKLHKVDTIIVDKTGTITKGKPTLVDIKNFSKINDEEFLSILATLENKSEHPIALAIINYVRENNISIGEVLNFKNIEGMGLSGTINNLEYFIGNAKLIEDLKLNFDASVLEQYTMEGKTPVLVATKQEVLGFVMVSDEIKPESKKAVVDLHKLGIKVIMITGDDEKAAKYISGVVGIDEVLAHAMPEDKLVKIKELQKEGHIVAMAGDGVNDAPALAQADIGIAMGTGTDVAIESAGITLLHGDISKLTKAVKLSKITMRGIKQNLFWAFFYNVVGIPLAAGLFYPIFGWLLNPVFAGFAMAMSSVSVVSNSLRIKTVKL